MVHHDFHLEEEMEVVPESAPPTLRILTYVGQCPVMIASTTSTSDMSAFEILGLVH